MQQLKAVGVQQLESTGLVNSTGEASLSRPFAPSWPGFVDRFRDPSLPLPEPWAAIFEPLRTPGPDGLTIVGQIGQSVDGRIATESGDSHYINQAAGLEHLHRLRSLCDAVLIGVGTAVADDPQLTVRRVEGRNPARIVLDPNGRLPLSAKLLGDDGARRIVLTAQSAHPAGSKGVEAIALPAPGGQIAPSAIRSALRRCGFRLVLIEGGAVTLSRFLQANCLDRLHVLVAPLILGSGRPGVVLPPIARVAEARRVTMRAFTLGNEVLLDCGFQILEGGTAKNSM
jgi:diaminohydroxyphosphoribosylaminopyrimidine deaminase / 5-amino-6-(5-phosphoribosylamino)uracil reductase